MNQRARAKLWYSRPIPSHFDIVLANGYELRICRRTSTGVNRTYIDIHWN